MPSVKNPNKPSKNRLAARANKIKKRSQKESAAGRVPAGIVKSDLKRGARPGLMPTSGPRKPISSKRQRKLDKKLGYALQRKMEAEGEVEMKGEYWRGCVISSRRLVGNWVNLALLTDVATEDVVKKGKDSKGEEQMEVDIS